MISLTLHSIGADTRHFCRVRARHAIFEDCVTSSKGLHLLWRGRGGGLDNCPKLNILHAQEKHMHYSASKTNIEIMTLIYPILFIFIYIKVHV